MEGQLINDDNDTKEARIITARHKRNSFGMIAICHREIYDKKGKIYQLVDYRVVRDVFL